MTKLHVKGASITNLYIEVEENITSFTAVEQNKNRTVKCKERNTF
jgi:hypothetical protein